MYESRTNPNEYVRDWMLALLTDTPHVGVSGGGVGFPSEFGREHPIGVVEAVLSQCTPGVQALWPQVRRWCGLGNRHVASGWQLWAELCIQGRVAAFAEDDQRPANDTGPTRMADVIQLRPDLALPEDAPGELGAGDNTIIMPGAAVAVEAPQRQAAQLGRWPVVGLATLAVATAVAVIWPSAPAPAVAAPLPVSARYATCEAGSADVDAGAAVTARPVSAPPTPRYRVAAPPTEHATSGPLVVRRKGRPDVAIEARPVEELPRGARIVELQPDTATVVSLDGSAQIALEPGGGMW